MRRMQQGVLFEEGGFRVVPQGLIVTRQGTLSEWSHALRTMASARTASSWAVGDLLNYADGRGWEVDAVEEVMEATRFKRGTLFNLKSLAGKFALERRRPELPFAYHAVVASLPAEEADELLAQAVHEAWHWEDLREHARHRRQGHERVAQTFPAGTFGVLYATPPWRGSPARLTMEHDAIAALAPQVQAITAPSALLYLAATNRHLEAALTVLKAWGFRFRGHHVTITPGTVNVTPFMRERHSLVLVGTRGPVVGPVTEPDSVLMGLETMAGILEQVYPDVPKVLLFAEQDREGWTRWTQAEPDVQPVRGIVVREEEVPV